MISLREGAVTVFYCLLWISFSAAVIIFNKALLIQGPFPTVLTFWHLFLSTIVTQILAQTTSLIDHSKSTLLSGRLFLTSIVPIGLSFSFNLVFNNAAYTFLSVSFIQMFKSIGPVVMLLVGNLLGLYRIDLAIFLTILVICLGVFISSYGEVHFNTVGILIQCAGIASEAIRLALSELLLSPSGVKMDPLTALYHFAPVCMVFCLFAAMLVDGPPAIFDCIQIWGAPTLFGNCLVAFLLNVSAVFLIRHTSSLTLTICGIPKAVLTMLVSTHFWGETITPVQLVGFMIASAGVVRYSQMDIRKSRSIKTEYDLQVEEEEGGGGRGYLSNRS
ncbi:hypothetical protein PDE_09862 [Penicillium oxalicum 114-2]|uniref:Sugar phosphate transporter domain-containing protein n=1 Tax=Penicillium oxalicum (strain 114-2 / CGMCC 5302) TaxID=933388 RepID=S8B7G9_PENO1|nr:hypothetical protein PDE_09862 [Penicillium oxalicum 114-2]